VVAWWSLKVRVTATIPLDSDLLKDNSRQAEGERGGESKNVKKNIWKAVTLKLVAAMKLVIAAFAHQRSRPPREFRHLKAARRLPPAVYR